MTQLSVLLDTLNGRHAEAKKRGHMVVNQLEFNYYAKVFGNMEQNTSVKIHAGRKSLTFKGIELRVI